MGTTATTFIRTAMQDLGVLGQGQAPTGNDLTDGLRRLNLMMGSWSVQSLTVPYVERFTSVNVSNVSTYTIGDGGDFDTPRPSGQSNLVGAGLLLASSSPAVEIPRGILTYDAYESIGIKGLTNTLWTDLLYRPTYPLGTIILWPVPTDVNGIALYLQRSLSKFDNLTTAYEFPEGTEEAIQTNLTVRIAPMFSVQVPPDIAVLAKQSMAAMKRNNVQLVDAVLDPMFLQSTPGAAYNINTGSVQKFGP